MGGREEVDPMFEEEGQGQEEVGNEETIQDPSDENGGEGEWAPDYSYKVMDDTLEFDEWIRPVIDNSDREKEIRELYTRAKGIDVVKEHLEKTKSQVKELESESSRYREEAEYAKQGIEGLKHLAKTDFASFAHLVGIDDKEVLGYANNRLDYQEKPEHERKRLDQDIQLRTQSYQRNYETEQLKRENERLIRSQHEASMNQALATPEIAGFAERFDKRMGEGSFKKHVQEYGSREFRMNKNYVQPLVAAQKIYADFKPLFEDKLDEVNQKKNSPKQKSPTNLGQGRAGTVVKKRLKSLSDLRKLGNEIAKQEGYA
jgi:hypothetical protein